MYTNLQNSATEAGHLAASLKTNIWYTLEHYFCGGIHYIVKFKNNDGIGSSSQDVARYVQSNLRSNIPVPAKVKAIDENLALENKLQYAHVHTHTGRNNTHISFTVHNIINHRKGTILMREYFTY